MRYCSLVTIPDTLYRHLQETEEFRMKKLKRTLLLFVLFSKRLFKKISFWLLLCAVPLSAAGMRSLSKGESGMLHIILCQENPADPLSKELITQLLMERSVIQYTLVEREEDAYKLVELGEADGAWIFPDEMQKQLDRFTAGELWGERLIRVVEREDNVALRLSREKLFGAIYPYISYSLYQNFILRDLGMEADEEMLRKDFESTAVEGSLFRFAFAGGDSEAADSAQQNYLVTPIRGMLALTVLLCGLASTMFFLQDQEKGILDVIPFCKRRGYLYIYQFAVMGYVALAVLGALYISGVFMGVYREVIWMAVYAVMCAGFCSMLQRICGNLRRLTAGIPILMLISFVLCPVFFSVRQFKAIQYMLPPFYYLNVIHNESYFYKMVFYCIIVYVIDLVCCVLEQKALLPVRRRTH